MEQKLHRYGGRELEKPRPIALRQCTSAAEADAVYALQNEVRAAMPDPELFVPDTREHIGNYLKYDLCVGAWDGSRLAAYLILRYCGRTEENYAAYLTCRRRSGTTGPTQTVRWSTRTIGATGCSGRCCRQLCLCCARASWAWGPR